MTVLAERPEIIGISMPGMPSGTPGIEKPQFGSLNVVAFGLGGVTAFMSL